MISKQGKGVSHQFFRFASDLGMRDSNRIAHRGGTARFGPPRLAKEGKNRLNKNHAHHLVGVFLMCLRVAVFLEFVGASSFPTNCFEKTPKKPRKTAKGKCEDIPQKGKGRAKVFFSPELASPRPWYKCQMTQNGRNALGKVLLESAKSGFGPPAYECPKAVSCTLLNPVLAGRPQEPNRNRRLEPPEPFSRNRNRNWNCRNTSKARLF